MRKSVDEDSPWWGVTTLYQLDLDDHDTVLELITKEDEGHIKPKLHDNADDSIYCTTSLTALRIL